MVRKKKKDTNGKTGQTYFKAKNGRFYKKIVVDGKTRCRFVSNAEAMGTIKSTKSSGKKSQSQAPPLKRQKTDDVSSSKAQRVEAQRSD